MDFPFQFRNSFPAVRVIHRWPHLYPEERIAYQVFEGKYCFSLIRLPLLVIGTCDLLEERGERRERERTARSQRRDANKGAVLSNDLEFNRHPIRRLFLLFSLLVRTAPNSSPEGDQPSPSLFIDFLCLRITCSPSCTGPPTRRLSPRHGCASRIDGKLLRVLQSDSDRQESVTTASSIYKG